MIYQVVVTDLKGEKITIDLCDNEKDLQRLTVMDLKEKLAARLPGNRGELIFGKDRLNEDNKRLFDYGIQHKSSIVMVIRVNGGLPL
uniref:Ubiquitin-like domain-containing protein n=1 Tax=Cyprinodon variegatus TaxID=28743 RepID=A0A3Q2CQL7_CYPVA